jgi:hypothetical protein
LIYSAEYQENIPNFITKIQSLETNLVNKGALTPIPGQNKDGFNDLERRKKFLCTFIDNMGCFTLDPMPLQSPTSVHPLSISTLIILGISHIPTQHD